MGVVCGREGVGVGERGWVNGEWRRGEGRGRSLVREGEVGEAVYLYSRAHSRQLFAFVIEAGQCPSPQLTLDGRAQPGLAAVGGHVWPAVPHVANGMRVRWCPRWNNRKGQGRTRVRLTWPETRCLSGAPMRC